MNQTVTVLGMFIFIHGHEAAASFHTNPTVSLHILVCV